MGEVVVDVIVRSGRRERKELNPNQERLGIVERELEGWCRTSGPCELSALTSLKDLWGSGLGWTPVVEQVSVSSFVPWPSSKHSVLPCRMS